MQNTDLHSDSKIGKNWVVVTLVKLWMLTCGRALVALLSLVLLPSSTINHLFFFEQTPKHTTFPVFWPIKERSLSGNSTCGNINEPQMGNIKSADSGSVTVEFLEQREIPASVIWLYIVSPTSLAGADPLRHSLLWSKVRTGVRGLTTAPEGGPVMSDPV